MTNASITIQKADGADIDRIESLLKANGLPYRDVRAKPECFFLAYADTEYVGVGGVEINGPNGLLRSVVVTESDRGKGYGATLCDALEEYARSNEVETLYLLTTTAAAFFRQCGYEEIDRNDAPSSIRQTTEFADLCPSTAICMRNNI